MKIFFGIKDYCLPAAEGVTYLKIRPDQRTTGMLKLKVVFQQLYQEDRQPTKNRD